MRRDGKATNSLQLPTDYRGGDGTTEDTEFTEELEFFAFSVFSVTSVVFSTALAYLIPCASSTVFASLKRM